MILCAVAVAAVAILLWCLKLEMNLEQSFIITSTVPRQDLYDFLSTPANLERSHPTIYKVSDIQKENDSVRFNIEEDLGGLIGVSKLAMRIISSSEISASTSYIQMDSYSNVANVTVTLRISDYNNATAPCLVSQSVIGHLPVSRTLSNHIPSVTVHVYTTVRAWRIFCYFISGHVMKVWDKTMRKTVDILGGELDLVNHCISSQQ